jgi:hypothetical protein
VGLRQRILKVHQILSEPTSSSLLMAIEGTVWQAITRTDSIASAMFVSGLTERGGSRRLRPLSGTFRRKGILRTHRVEVVAQDNQDIHIA